MAASAADEAHSIDDEDLATASAQMKASMRGVVPLSLAVLVVVQLLAAWMVTTQFATLAGMDLAVSITVVTVAILTPVVYAISAVTSKRTLHQLAGSLGRERELGEEARRREFETRLGNALEMADSESRIMTVASRAVRAVAGGGRLEILLADNSHSHLERALVHGAPSGNGGCKVESPDQCVAARRGQTQTFSDSENLDACPYLQDRDVGRCAAVCVPVSIMGRTVGVVHRVEALPATLPPAATSQLEILANQLGARLGMLRVMGETQLQASTDGLTGLPNRRAFENQLRRFAQGGAEYCVVLADLDHFKKLNDTHGHEAGDRALRIFSGVLREELRPDDVACRLGGEEFAIALPGCSASDALAACERLREALALAVRAGGSASFTASYGVAPFAPGLTTDQLVANADLALYAAKDNGRNRASLYNPDLVMEPAPAG